MSDPVKRRLSWLLALMVPMLIVAACGSSSTPDTPDAPATDADGVPVMHIPARYNTAMAADAETLASVFDAAFVGEVTGEAEQRSETSPKGNRLPVSVFTVRVESSAGGPEPGSIVEVEQLGGVTESDIGLVHLLTEGDSPIQVGGRYLFMVTDRGGGTFRASPLARFPIEGGRVQASEGFAELSVSDELDGLPVVEAMERVAGVGR